ncbi:MAG: GNAT family N-acetyltransferase [Solirubrobacteraceae bacterium]
MFWIGARPGQRPSLSPDKPTPERPSPIEHVVVQLEPPAGARAQEILRSYLEDIVGRYHRRQATAAELALALKEAPSDDLAPPQGVFLVASMHEATTGCVGMRLLAGRTGEVTRLFVARHARRQGLAMRLMDDLEQLARDRGLTRLRLDTRHDLIEARRLYARRGFREIAPFNHGPYADHWLQKTL